MLANTAKDMALLNATRFPFIRNLDEQTIT